jgi:uncharacterized nucleotidyltransferase DUF6036
MGCSSLARYSTVSDPQLHKFTRSKIVEALQALGEELVAREVRGQIFIVGGAAIALAYARRRVTKDIDAVFEPKAVIYEAATKVAEDLGLPEDWLNDAAKAYMPGQDRSARPLPEVEGIEITTASPRYLLAMKLMAMRIGEDDSDVEMLLRECRITSTEDALQLLRLMYPAREAPLKTRLFLETLFE